MTGKENLTSVTTGAPPSRHKFPSNKAASAQVTHNFSMQLAEGQTFPNVSKRLLHLKAFSQLYHSTVVFSKEGYILNIKVNRTKHQNPKATG